MTDDIVNDKDGLPALIEQTEFEANIDYYVEAAEAGREFWLTRNGSPICRLTSTEA